MIVAIGGGTGGFKNYLETGQKKGREIHRDALDQRITLFGDLNVFELATSMQAGEGQKYDHITLAFSENHVSDEMLQIAVSEFRDHVLAAWPESERHKIAFYAEAHRPKILSYTNSLTGESVQRLVHIHIGMGKHDLLTGKLIEPLGYLGLSDNLKFIDAWQEAFNARHGFSSPKDNPKITPENAIDTLARYKGAKPDELETFNQQKASLEIVLQKQIIEKNITTWSDFEKLLKTHGQVSKMREGKPDEVFRILPDGADRAMRLKGVFFQRQFIERPTSEKLAIIQDKAKVAYLEQMQPRKEPTYVASVLKEWHTTKARENRFLHTGSKFYKEQYQPSDVETRLQLLDEIERKYNGLTSPASDQRRRKITPTRDRVLGLPIRHLDGIQKRSEMLLLGNNGVDVSNWQHSQRDSLGMRQTDESGGSNGTNGSTAQGSASSQNRGDSAGSGDHNFTQLDGRLGGLTTQGRKQREPIFQPSSIIDRFIAEQRDRYEQAADKERFAEIRKHLDCTQLLNGLSHSQGLNPSLYEVTQAKDGTPRVKAGSRHLTPSDFLTKELGLPWKEAAQILRKSYELQIGSKITNPRNNKAVSTPLWKEFKAERDLTGVELKKRLNIFASTAKATRAALAEKLKVDQKQVLSGLTGEARKAKYSLLKIQAAIAKAELNDILSESRQALRDSIQPIQADAWRIFLQQQVNTGNLEALAELKRIDDTAYEKQIYAVTIGTINLEDDEAKIKRRRLAHPYAAKILLSQLVPTAGKNKEIIYQLNGRNVLQDLGRHLAILDENSEEAIAAGLLLAMEKFGSNLTLTGSPAFQQRAVEIAVAQGIIVKFADPKLEEMRQKLTEEKRQAERASKPMKVVDQRYDEDLAQRVEAWKLKQKQANAAVPEKIEIELTQEAIQIATEEPVIAPIEADKLKEKTKPKGNER